MSRDGRLRRSASAPAPAPAPATDQAADGNAPAAYPGGAECDGAASGAAHDARLLDAIARGDPSAFAEFYRRHAHRVLRFCAARLGGDDAAAQDVLHECMLEVWRVAGTFQGRARAATWLLSIAHHKSVDQLRRRHRRRECELPEEPLGSDDCPAADALAASENRERLYRCIALLPAVQRAALHLAFFEDLPYREIAGILGCPEGTVKTRVFHAKLTLKHCLTRGD